MEASKLKEILEQHKLWIETNGVQGTRAFFYRANLSGADLTGANLYCAYLHRADLLGANLRDAYLWGADLTGADLTYANLSGANLSGAILERANLKDTIGLPDISWIIPGCLAQLNNIKYLGFWLEKEIKRDNFIQDSLGFIIQNNSKEKTFDILVGDRIIRGIPDWVKLSGMKQIESESV